jgi:nucleotide-binding universal stress UspA family protein
VADRLERLAINIGADLLVMGGYGHGRLRETVFGGCTRHFLDRCDRPVLMMH